MIGIPTPVQTIQATLKAVDSTLASAGVVAEAVHTSLSPLPPSLPTTMRLTHLRLFS
jgi:hypothetical protein